MTTDAAITALEPLPIRRRKLVQVATNHYRVRAASGEMKEIEATTAYEAFNMSGFVSAVKIERVSNIDKDLIEKSEFSNDNSSESGLNFDDVTPKEQSPLERLKLRKNPLISADELDALMRALQATAPAQTSAAEEPLVPESATSPQTEGVTPGPGGMDVHGDGFDEIIPATASPKPAAMMKSSTPAEASPVPPAPPAQEPPAGAPPVSPETELSPEEVSKLLGGK